MPHNEREIMMSDKAKHTVWVFVIVVLVALAGYAQNIEYEDNADYYPNDGPMVCGVGRC
jgi:hypothetical protein